jgi:hypothetical protein
MSDWGESVKVNLTTGKKRGKMGGFEMINGPA